MCISLPSGDRLLVPEAADGSEEWAGNACARMEETGMDNPGYGGQQDRAKNDPKPSRKA